MAPTTVGGSAVEPAYGVTTYDVIGLPPSPGAVHRTVADESPAVAVTPVGAPGTVGGGAVPPPANTTVPSSQTVFAPVSTVASDVAPAPTIRSSVSRSMFPFGEMLPRTVQPAPPVNAWPKPESAYTPSASSPPAAAGAVCPEWTVVAAAVVPLPPPS